MFVRCVSRSGLRGVRLGVTRVFVSDVILVSLAWPDTVMRITVSTKYPHPVTAATAVPLTTKATLERHSNVSDL